MPAWTVYVFNAIGEVKEKHLATVVLKLKIGESKHDGIMRLYVLSFRIAILSL